MYTPGGFLIGTNINQVKNNANTCKSVVIESITYVSQRALKKIVLIYKWR